MAGIADRAAVDRDRAGLDQGLEPRARQLGDMRGEHAVEPLAGLIVAMRRSVDLVSHW